MKNAVLNLAAFLLLASSFVACKKEKTFKDQLVGNWQSVQVNIAGEDVTGSYTYTMNLEGSQEFDLDVTSVVPLTGTITQSYSGDWTEDETKQDITLNYSNGEQKTWDVTAISDTKLTAELIGADNKRYQVKFDRQ